MQIDVRDAPYRNVGQAMTDTISGQVSFYFPAVTAAIPQLTGGKLRGLALGATKRLSQAPEVPTVAEEIGVQGLEVITWYGLFAPAGTPKEVVSRIHSDISMIMETSDARERILKTSAYIIVSGPEEFAAQVRADTAKYGKFVRELGLKE